MLISNQSEELFKEGKFVIVDANGDPLVIGKTYTNVFQMSMNPRPELIIRDIRLGKAKTVSFSYLTPFVYYSMSFASGTKFNGHMHPDFLHAGLSCFSMAMPYDCEKPKYWNGPNGDLAKMKEDFKNRFVPDGIGH